MKLGILNTGKSFAACFLVLVMSAFLTTAARADLRICNTTQDVVGVAIGYRSKDSWVSQGWWTVNPISCVSALPGALTSRFYYIYAETADGDSRWEGPVNMCIMEEKFEIKGVSDCFPRGYQKVGFQEIDTGGQANWMIQLSGASSLTSSPVIIDTDSK